MNYLMEENKPIVKLWFGGTWGDNAQAKFFVEDKKLNYKNIFKLLQPDNLIEFTRVGGYDNNGTHIEHTCYADNLKDDIGKLGYVLEPVKLFAMKAKASVLDEYIQSVDFNFETLCFSVDGVGNVFYKGNSITIELPNPCEGSGSESWIPPNEYYEHFLMNLERIYPQYYAYYTKANADDLYVFSGSSLVCIFPKVSLEEFIERDGYTETVTLLMQ